MDPLRDEISRWLRSAPEALEQADLSAEIAPVGRVARVGDGVARVDGLWNARAGEIIRFADGGLGLAMSIRSESLDCVLLGSGEHVAVGSRATGTGDIARMPVGPEMLGRIVDPLGAPLDGGPAIEAVRRDPVERPAPGILDRALITEPLMTGVSLVDGMIPLGRGQRTLLMGDRKTGKTALAVDAIINQRDTDIVCVYAMIGQKASTAEQAIDAVRRHGAAERCVFVIGEAGAAPGAQWLTPYAAATVAEYFRDNGQHALLVLDDLSKHATIHRQISLLLRRPPGREAYPGDVFYLHSRLLERASKLSPELGGGSLSALPIVETQAGNLSGFIPTNLISITDGQIYFEPKLFYEGQKPAINVGLSVSRVGAKTQAAALKAIAGRLKLDYAQFIELEVFTRLGAMIDDRTRQRIERGRRIRAALIQPQYAPRSLAAQTAILLAVQEGLLDPLPLSAAQRFTEAVEAWLGEACPEAAARIAREGALADADRTALLEALKGLVARFEASAES